MTVDDQQLREPIRCRACDEWFCAAAEYDERIVALNDRVAALETGLREVTYDPDDPRTGDWEFWLRHIAKVLAGGYPPASREALSSAAERNQREQQ